MSACDRDAYKALLDLLEASGEFAHIRFSPGADPRRIQVPVCPAVELVPESWTEVPDNDASGIVRTGDFQLLLIVADTDPWQRYQSLDRLTCRLLNLLSGSDLNGTSLAGLTHLGRGEFSAPVVDAELRCVLHGRFGYRLANPQARDVS